MAETITPVEIAQEARDRYLSYAWAVIRGRALPDVRDGLKPVQRRILYAMFHELRLFSDGRPAKSARIVGSVIGSYHPHGDSSIYEAMVRMAQDWSMRIRLVQGQGNFGSVDGDPPAAYRYTEAKLAPVAERLLSELRQDTVEMRPTFDNATQEPIVLPAQFPNLLVNGTTGIAVAMATNIPPHNLGEVVKACVQLIDHPESETAELLKHIKAPDFPLGGKIIASRETLLRVYTEGQGSIKVQGEWHVEEPSRRSKQIVITSIPYGVDKGKLMADIGAIIEDRKLPQALGITNESKDGVLDKDGVRITIDIKPDANPDVIMAYLFKHTTLQQSFAFNLTCLVPGYDGKIRAQRLGLKDILRHFLDFRLSVVRKRFEFELAALRRRIHILDGFRLVFGDLDRAIRIIRESAGKSEASARLIGHFHLDEEQATAILDAQLYKIAQLEIQKILDELQQKRAEAQSIQEILASETRLWSVIKNELIELAEKHADKRRSKLASQDDVLEFDPEAYIVRENTNVVLTRDGYLKRVGRLASVESTRVREGDAVQAVLPASTVDHVVFFADDGTAYTMRVHDMPASSGYGEPITKFFKLADQVRIVGATTTDERFVPAKCPTSGDESAGPYVLAVTASGLTLRTPLIPFRTASTKSGRRYVKLSEGDRVVMASVVTNEPSLMLASSSGHVTHFALSEVSILLGAGKGVIGMRLEPGAMCLGGAVISEDFPTLTVESTSGKIIELRKGSQPLSARGGRGAEIVKRGGLVRVVPRPIELPDWERLERNGA